MVDAKIVGQRIKAFRKKKGWTQSEFAEALHVSFQAVSNWERGVTPPELDNLVRIADLFGVLVDDLLRSGSEPLYLGIDGGGTKTEFAVVNAEGRVLCRFVRAGSNPNDIGFEKSFSVISEGIREALIRCPGIVAVLCGIAGITVGDHRTRMQAQLSKSYPTLTFGINSDAANLLGMDDGIRMIVISGTGSVVFAKTEEEIHRLGGWGYLLDRGGSAYDIGRDGLAAALEEEDCAAPPSLMGTLLRKELECENLFSVIDKLYGGGKPYIASMARPVFAACEAGDPVAAEILEKNAARLAELLDKAVALYGVPPKAIAGGGVFENYEALYRPLIEKHCGVTLCRMEVPPVYGACRTALKLSGGVPAEDFAERFEKTYKEKCHEDR